VVSLLELRGLAVGHGGRRVVSGLDLALEDGQVLCVLGPNGGGKTTLLKTLLGLLPPLAGEVRVVGATLHRSSRARTARIVAYVPQSHEICFAFSAEEVVLTGRTAHLGPFATPSARDRELARAALGTLGIEALRTRVYTTLSGGERQLVLIARALAQEPKLLVMDEPTSSLDLGNQGRVLRVVRRLAGARLGIVLSSHDPNHAFACADQVALLADGGLRALGPPRSALTPEHLQAAYGTAIRVASLPGTGVRICVPALWEDEPRLRRGPDPVRRTPIERRSR